MITIYHNPRCRKSRAGHDYLKSKGVEFKVVEYLAHPFTREVLKDLLVKLNKPVQDLIRTQEDLFREKFRGKHFTDEEWITILLENPKLIQRPIVVKGYRAVLGQTEEELDKLFG
jgi:arsenate reductase